MSEPWPISWIDEETVIEIATRSFKKAIKKIVVKQDLKTDPTLIVSLATLLDMNPQDIDILLDKNAAIKTFQNAIGTFHQTILGSVEGWSDMGSRGGVLDIQSTKPVPAADNRMVIAEIKMRYNTIKGSDECHTWDKIDQAVRSRGGKNECVGYIIQMIPEKSTPYDREWKVSKRTPAPHVRAIDGRSAYHLVTGDPNALPDLIHQLPRILNKVRAQVTGQSLDVNSTLPALYIDQAIGKSLPGESALGD